MTQPREYVTEPGPLLDVPIPATLKANPDRKNETTTNRQLPTGIEALVCADIAQRQSHGLSKYGVSVAANPLDLRAWLVHAYEEMLDGAVYLRRAIAELDAQTNGTNQIFSNPKQKGIFLEP